MVHSLVRMVDEIMKNIGDIVNLRSGGRYLMTVTAYSEKSKMVEVCWIADDGSPQDATYPEAALDGPFVVKVSVVPSGV